MFMCEYTCRWLCSCMHVCIYIYVHVHVSKSWFTHSLRLQAFVSPKSSEGPNRTASLLRAAEFYENGASGKTDGTVRVQVPKYEVMRSQEPY